MRYAVPLSETLSETHDSTEYSFKYFKAPESSSGFEDEGYDIWDGDITKDVGEYIIVAPLKRIYRSTIASNKSYPPANLDKWVDYGTTNSNRMFAVNEQILAPSKGTDAVIEFDFSRKTTFAIVGSSFASVTLELTNKSTSEVVWSQTFYGKNVRRTNFGNYFYDEFRNKTRLVVDDIKYLPSSTLKVTFNGDCDIDVMVIGRSKELGCTLYGTSITPKAELKITTDEYTGFNNVKILGKYRELGVQIVYETADFNLLATNSTDFVGENVLWIPTEVDKFSELTTLGYMESLEIPLDNPSKIELTTSIVGFH